MALAPRLLLRARAFACARGRARSGLLAALVPRPSFAPRVAAGFGGASLYTPFPLACSCGSRHGGIPGASRLQSGARRPLLSGSGSTSSTEAAHRPSALDVAASAEVGPSVAGVDSLETPFARDLPQLGCGRARRGSPSSPDRPRPAGVMLLTLRSCGGHVPRRPLHDGAPARALAALAGRATHFIDVVPPFRRCAPSTRGKHDGAIGRSARVPAVDYGTLRGRFSLRTVLELAATLGIAIVAVTFVAPAGVSASRPGGPSVLAPELYLPLRNLAAQYHTSATSSPGRALPIAPSRPAPVPGRRGANPRDFPFVFGAFPSPTRHEMVWYSIRSISSSPPARRSPSSARAAAARAQSRRSCSALPSRRVDGWRRGRSISLPATQPPGGRAWPGYRSGRPSSAARRRQHQAGRWRCREGAYGGRRSWRVPTPSSASSRMGTTRSWRRRAPALLRAAPANRTPASVPARRSLVILDDPTANLDRGVLALGPRRSNGGWGRTMLVIAHRAELARRADRS